MKKICWSMPFCLLEAYSSKTEKIRLIDRQRQAEGKKNNRDRKRKILKKEMELSDHNFDIIKLLSSLDN